MVELCFTPRCSYTVTPYKWTYRLALGLIESWPDVVRVAELAQRRCGYGNTDSGFGLEYPTRPERADQVRFWRWEWHMTGRVKTRKYHFPEADYLAVLAALLHVRGFVNEAEAVVQAARKPLPLVELLPVPDPYDLSNYSFNQAFTYEVKHCVRLILDQRDFALAQARAQRREGFTVADGSRLEYRDGGAIRLHLAHGHTQDATEALYNTLLERLPKEVERWTATH